MEQLSQPRTKRRAKKAQTRQHIVQVAAAQFSERGIVATKTSDIAEGAGLAHGTVFVHFPTKEELVSAVVSEVGSEIARRVRQLVSSGGSVRAVLTAHVDGLLEFETFYTRLILESPLLPPDARRVIVEIQSAIASHLEEVMAREAAAGQLRQLPLHLAFNTWIGLLHHYLANRDLFAPKGSVLSLWGQRLVDHYLELLAP